MLWFCLRFWWHQHILSFPCVYFQTNLLISINQIFCFPLWYLCYLPVGLNHQHRLAADVSRSVSVPPGIFWRKVEKQWQWTISLFLTSMNRKHIETDVYLYGLNYRFHLNTFL
jgi:hypothetical protein